MTYRFPPLNGLKAFEAAARHSSFKAAAGEMGVTAGAVSQQVKRLEESLGVALFRRLPQGLSLTKEGAHYLPDVSEAFHLLTRATEGVAPNFNGRKFTLGISAAVRELLPGNWPNSSNCLDDYIREVRTTDAIDDLWNNELDVLLLEYQTNQTGLFEQVINVSKGETIVFVTRAGLAECRQSKAIIVALNTRFA